MFENLKCAIAAYQGEKASTEYEKTVASMTPEELLAYSKSAHASTRDIRMIAWSRRGFDETLQLIKIEAKRVMPLIPTDKIDKFAYMLCLVYFNKSPNNHERVLEFEGYTYEQINEFTTIFDALVVAGFDEKKVKAMW